MTKVIDFKIFVRSKGVAIVQYH